jgi:hypothetical protein
MAKVRQLTVSLENRPGALARVAKALAEAKANITGQHCRRAGFSAGGYLGAVRNLAAGVS